MFLVCFAVLLTVHYLIQFRSVLMANKWLLTAWIGLGVMFFVMVVVVGALLVYQYSGIGGEQQAHQQ